MVCIALLRVGYRTVSMALRQVQDSFFLALIHVSYRTVSTAFLRIKATGQFPWHSVKYRTVSMALIHVSYRTVSKAFLQVQESFHGTPSRWLQDNFHGIPYSNCFTSGTFPIVLLHIWGSFHRHTSFPEEIVIVCLR